MFRNEGREKIISKCILITVKFRKLSKMGGKQDPENREMGIFSERKTATINATELIFAEICKNLQR